MRGLWAGLAAGLAFFGCSGTEVGNPEIVSARVAMLPAGSGWAMQSFPFKVMSLEYRGPGNDSGVIWNAPSGNEMDAADTSYKLIQRAAFSHWSSATLNLAFTAPADSLGDTTHWNLLRSPGWASFRYTYDSLDRKMVFAMPAAMNVRVTFDSLELKSLAGTDSLNLVVWFDCNAWLAAMGSNFNFAMHAGADGPFAVLSPTANANAYQALLDTLPDSFRESP